MEKYKIKYQLLGSQTRKIVCRETAFFQDKETTIKAYEEEASKYVQFGIHHMYFAELITYTTEHESIMSRENIVDWRSEYL